MTPWRKSRAFKSRPLLILTLVVCYIAFDTTAARTQQPQLKPDWIADPKTGCRVWNSNPQPNETITWDGPCTNGLATGHGTLQWFKEGQPRSRYEGEFRDGKGNGRGVATYATGGRYEGEFRDGNFNGRGVFTSATGGRYEGEFRDGKFNGRGVMTYATGGRYEGEFQDGKENGRGVVSFATGDRYEGDFQDGKPAGRGAVTLGGKSFEGEFRDGNFNGQGVLISANGDRYEGGVRDGKPDGLGTYLSRDGQTYTGIWTRGCFRQEDRVAWVGETAEECK